MLGKKKLIFILIQIELYKMDIKKLIYMTNQISNYFQAYPENKAVVSTINHINQFWDKRMKKEIIIHVNNDGDGLNEIALKAIQSISESNK